MNPTSQEEEIEYLQAQLTRIQHRTSIPSQSLLHAHERNEAFFQRLEDEWHRLYELVCEANTIAKELQRSTNYQLILRIPPAFLKPDERTIENLCEPAVRVEQTQQIWTMEKFQVRLDHMREWHTQWQNQGGRITDAMKRNDPFVDAEESNQFLGVSNICLKALFYHTKLDYTVPVISPQGQISGSMHVILDQTGLLPMEKYSDFQINSMTRSSVSQGICLSPDAQSLSGHSPSENSLEDEGIDDSISLYNERNDKITIKFTIKEIRDLPVSGAGQVICRYTFINPKLDQTMISTGTSDTSFFSFDQEKEYSFTLTDCFLTKCRAGALSIEVWHQAIVIPRPMESKESRELRVIGQRWKDVKRHIQYSIEVQELNPTGQWCAVDVDTPDGIISGGVYRLKQGQSKRLAVHLRLLPSATAMPMELETIRSVEIGSISTRKLEAPVQLDSYQDEELGCLREQWIDRIDQRKHLLEGQIQMLSDQTEKTFADLQRETKLLEELIQLAEERNMAEFPPTGSGLPGSPAGWTVPPTIEKHRPVIYLHRDPLPNETAGLRAPLTGERSADMKKLSLIQQQTDEIGVTAQWDPSVHEATAINQVTPPDSLVYLIVKIVVTIAPPVGMELVLRKRLAVTIGKAESWWSGKTLKNYLGYKKPKRTSVVYEVISHIPEYTPPTADLRRDMKDFLQLASSIDSLLLVDRLRQEVLLAENSAQRLTLHKSSSVPNIRHSRGHRQRIAEEREEQYLPSLANTTNEKDDCSLGDRVIVNTAHQVHNKLGYIRFVGKIHIRHGIWYGVELDEPFGKNDGALDGRYYFQSPPRHGLFVRRDKLTMA